VDGFSSINTSAITGENKPKDVGIGDEVISGCINNNKVIRIRAIKNFEDSTVSKILELVENASDKKAKSEKFVTKFARYYTPIVVGLAILLAFIPPLFTIKISFCFISTSLLTNILYEFLELFITPLSVALKIPALN